MCSIFAMAAANRARAPLERMRAAPDGSVYFALLPAGKTMATSMRSAVLAHADLIFAVNALVVVETVMLPIQSSDTSRVDSCSPRSKSGQRPRCGIRTATPPPSVAEGADGLSEGFGKGFSPVIDG
jgi:hypothetical protein